MSHLHYFGVARGVRVSTFAFPACHRCRSAGLSVVRGSSFRAVVCCLYLVLSSGVFREYSCFLPSFVGNGFGQ